MQKEMIKKKSQVKKEKYIQMYNIVKKEELLHLQKEK